MMLASFAIAASVAAWYVSNTQPRIIAARVMVFQ